MVPIWVPMSLAIIIILIFIVFAHNGIFGKILTFLGSRKIDAAVERTFLIIFLSSEYGFIFFASKCVIFNAEVFFCGLLIEQVVMGLGFFLNDASLALKSYFLSQIVPACNLF